MRSRLKVKYNGKVVKSNNNCPDSVMHIKYLKYFFVYTQLLSWKRIVKGELYSDREKESKHTFNSIREENMPMG